MIKFSVRELLKMKSTALLRVRAYKKIPNNSISESISDVMQGFNSTIFAYGQTGSGKTYTMFGQHWDDNARGH